MKLNIFGIPVEVDRRRVKSLRLEVAKDGNVTVIAPGHLSAESIGAYVEGRFGWITKQREALGIPESIPAPRRYEEGENLCFDGVRYILKIEHSYKRNSLRTSKRIDKETELPIAVLSTRPTSTPELRSKFIRACYLETAKPRVDRAIDKWSAITGIYPSEYVVKYMKKCYSASDPATGKISINSRIVEKDPFCLEYVVLAALCELRYSKKDPEYKATLDTHMPYWRDLHKKVGTKLLKFDRQQA